MPSLSSNVSIFAININSFFFVNIELVGLTANLIIISCPEVIPPSDPPELLDLKEILFFKILISSAFSSPLNSADLNPEPISKPLTAGILIIALAKSASTLSNTGSPRPIGTPETFI